MVANLVNKLTSIFVSNLVTNLVNKLNIFVSSKSEWFQVQNPPHVIDPFRVIYIYLEPVCVAVDSDPIDLVSQRSDNIVIKNEK